MPKKKILFLITKATWGGAQRYVYDLATNLPKEKYAPTVAFGTHGKLAGDLSRAGVNLRQLPSLGRDIAIVSDIKSFFEILKTIREVRPEIIHLNSSKAAILGALVARVSGVPKIIFTVHGWPFKEDKNFLAEWAIYFLSWLTVFLSHTTIVISKEDEKLGKSMMYVGRKIHYMALGIQPTPLLPRAEARTGLLPPEIISRHERDLWVVTIAELHQNKNLFTAIDAVARYNEVHLPHIFYLLIGDGELRGKLEETLTRRRVRERIMLLGFVPEAARFLKAFDIFFLPSKKEGLPLVLLESGQAEIPVVGSAIGGIRDIVGDGAGLLRRPNDVEGFVETLYEYAKNTEKRARLGENLRAHIAREFSFVKTLVETTALYES